MNRYDGNTGRFERVPDTEPVMFQLPPLFTEEVSGELKKPSGQSGILGGLGGMLGGLGGSHGGTNGALGGLGSMLGGLGGSHGGTNGALGGLGGILGGLGGSHGESNGILGGILGKQGGLGSILSKFSLSNLELEDIMLVGVLYLLYRESGDIEFLLIAGAMLFL